MTVNSSGIGPLKRFLLETTAHVVLAQATRVGSQDSMNETSAWCLRQGWKSLWSWAVSGPRGGMSAGTAIFARKELGLLELEGTTIESHCQGRFRAAMVQAPGYCDIIVGSVYLRVSEGLSPANLDILGQIGAVISSSSLPALIMGDMNMGPAEFMGSDFLGRLSARLLVGNRPTCVTRYSQSIIDFGFTTRWLWRAVDQIKVTPSRHIATHRPVSIRLIGAAAEEKITSMDVPRRLPTVFPFGPLLEFPVHADPWPSVAAVIDQAESIIKAGPSESSKDGALAGAYRAVVDALEATICLQCGTEGSRHTLAGPPVVREKSLLPKPAKRAAARWASHSRHFRRCHGILLDVKGAMRSLMAGNLARSEAFRMAALDEELGEDPPEGEQQTEPQEVTHTKARIGGMAARIARMFEAGATPDDHDMEEMEGLIDEVLVSIEKEEDLARKIADQGWKHWVQVALLGGAGKAHRWCTEPQAWRPNAIKTSSG